MVEFFLDYEVWISYQFFVCVIDELMMFYGEIIVFIIIIDVNDIVLLFN